MPTEEVIDGGYVRVVVCPAQKGSMVVLLLVPVVKILALAHLRVLEAWPLRSAQCNHIKGLVCAFRLRARAS